MTTINAEPAETAKNHVLCVFREVCVSRRDQKSNCAPSLKNRACRTLVGRSHWLLASVENVLVTVNGQLLLNTL